MKTTRFIFSLALCACSLMLHAGVKRALIIGIDSFRVTNLTPAAFVRANGGLTNPLSGCVNDARSVKQLIMARYGFMEQNIDTLMDHQATRENIINALNKLIGQCEPGSGDVVLIYFAGHGSQVTNSLSYDGTGLDQTIVPSDFYDIRNKELSGYFNQLMDHGVTLTTIFDCCHSGSIARGNSLPVAYVSRQLPSLAFDAADNTRLTPIEERGALVFSAAQRNQLAKECTDENGITHGAFTLAFLKAINSATSNESAQKIFTRIVANLKSDGGPKDQDPVMGANEQRRNATLFGMPVTDATTRTVVGIQQITDGYVQLRGGYELSIYPGCRFAKADGKDTLEVVSVQGIASSLAKVIKGDIRSFHPGDLVEMLNWVTPDRPTLLLWAPGATMTSAQLHSAIAPVNDLFTSGYCTQVHDQTAAIPQYVVQYNTNAWFVSEAGKNKITRLESLTEKNLKKHIKKGTGVCLQLPPTKELESELKSRIGAGTQNSAVDFTSDPLSANYILAGRSNGRLEYALVRPNVSAGDSSAEPALPLRTNWISSDNAAKASDSLADYAVRLGKLNAWLNLASPPDEFPYYLALKHAGGDVVKPNETVYGGDRLELILLLDTINFKPYYCERYINVFSVDAHGNMKLLYPRPELGDGNRVQYRGKFQSRRMIPLEKTAGTPLGFTIGTPYGYDTYFMVASETPLPPDIFKSDGVLTRGGPPAGNAPENGLTRMMRNCGSRTRGNIEDPPAVTSMLWSVQKVQLLSAEKK